MNTKVYGMIRSCDKIYRAISFFCILVIYSCSQNSGPSMKSNPANGKPWLVLELEKTNLLATEIAHGLDEPWEILWGPDQHLWITQHKGKVKRINPDNGRIKELLSLDDVYFSRTPGLLGMVLHPDFDTDPLVYLHYNYVDSSITEIDYLGRSSNVRSKVVRYSYLPEKDTLVNPEIILPNIPGSGHHNGARLAITADRKLLLAIGDTGNREAIYDKNALVGKVLRMNLDGSVPNDNPMPGSYFYSMGHRNPQGLVAAGGKVYSSEHGPNNDDELNLILAGGSYGWPYVEGFCDKENEQDYCDSVQVMEPLVSWTPTIAPAGLDYYNSPAIPEWQNSLLLTCLKGRSLRMLKLNASGDEIVDQRIYLQKQFGRLRDLCVSPQGEIYLITSNTDWHISWQPWMYDNVPADGNDRIIKLERMSGPSSQYKSLPVVREDSAQIPLFLPERFDRSVAGASIYVKNCGACHLPTGKGVPSLFPPLIDTEWTRDKKKLITTTLTGLTGEVEVNGVKYDEVMPGFAVSLSDQEIAEILNYVLIHLNNSEDSVKAEEVAAIRRSISPR